MSTLKAPITRLDHCLGPDDAAVTLVEYGDYECPHCAAAHPVVQLLLRQVGDKLRFVFRHFPLTQVHPNAEAAAESAEFCGVHGLFWEMHDRIYTNRENLAVPRLFALVRELGLSEAKLRQALMEQTFAPKVQSDFLGGVRSGVNGTPSFFINGRQHDGSYAFEDLYSAVEANLDPEVIV
jgi:protein-disulfide isomerase